MAQFLQRRAEATRNGTFDVERDDLEFYQRFPAVAEYLCHSRWENGEKRETTTFMVFFEDGVFKCWIHDRALKQSAFVQGRTMQELVVSLEDSLAHDLCVWRADRPGGKKS